MKKKAFTLIELLVVIAIIAILATLSVLALQNARAKARDSKRVADVKQIMTALELYFNDASGYPATLGTSIAYDGNTYLTVVPSSPNPQDGDCTTVQNTYAYTQDDSGDSYHITYCLGGKTGEIDADLNTATPAGLK
ncbi:MAG: type II secretion system GspH family protein [Planctomycetes bacterium]|jgi:general secretion pathway protein G|nr:type II secretion system GspH family protein [Planctomycetota bacterium]